MGGSLGVFDVSEAGDTFLLPSTGLTALGLFDCCTINFEQTLNQGALSIEFVSLDPVIRVNLFPESSAKLIYEYDRDPEPELLVELRGCGGGVCARVAGRPAHLRGVLGTRDVHKRGRPRALHRSPPRRRVGRARSSRATTQGAVVPLARLFYACRLSELVRWSDRGLGVNPRAPYAASAQTYRW